MLCRREQLLDLLERQQYKCASTGRDLTPATAILDHIVPVQKGGTNGIENVQIVHVDVNKAKNTLTQDEFVSLCREVVAHADSSCKSNIIVGSPH